MRSLVIAVASGGYLGYIPVASGTFGTLLGIPLFFVFAGVLAHSVTLAVAVYVALVAVSCWVAGKADVYLDEHDSHKIVIDEIVGYLAATLFLVPSWTNVIVAFFIFRGLDVVKPFPAGYVDKHLPGGAGVVLDDVISGLYSNLLTRLIIAMGLVG